MNYNSIVLFFFLLFCYRSNAQQQQDFKRDHTWMFGYDGLNNSKKFGTFTLSFNNNKLSDSTVVKSPVDFTITNAAICDTAGKLLLYTDGIRLYNGLHKVVKNGESIGVSIHGDNIWTIGNVIKGALILPFPEHPNQYVVLHQRYEDLDKSYAHSFAVFQNIVDMDVNKGEGEVIEKNSVVLEDTLESGIVATRHANGRDWWIIAQKENSNYYYILLLSNKGTKIINKQKAWNVEKTGLRDCSFSPDGTHFVTYNLITYENPNPIDLFNFDRCTGELTQIERLEHRDTLASSHALAFSPNSRFLYVFSSIYGYQYDMTAPNLRASCDSLLMPEPNTRNFFLAQNAPDGKIYLANPAGLRYLNTIEHPNLKGKACEVKKQSVHLPRITFATLPNYPNFRLGALARSPCDTLYGAKGTFVGVKLYPNPFMSGDLHLLISNLPSFSKGELFLYNALGQEVVQFPFLQGAGREYSFPLQDSNLPSAVYYWVLRLDEGQVASGKLVVVQ